MPKSRRRPSVARTAPKSDPFTAAQASTLGWTPEARRQAVGRGDWERVHPGVFAEPLPELPGHARARAVNLRKACASALACERAVISHGSAAIASRLPTLNAVHRRPCLTAQSGTPMRRLAGVHLHRATLLDPDVRTRGRYRVTSPARTVLDVAREHGRDAGVVCADAALREIGGRSLTTRDELAEVFERCAAWPGAAAARRTVEQADGLAESPLESLSRMRMLDSRLPRPSLQAKICDEWGVIIARSDFYWDEYGVTGEADGALKYVNGQPVIIARDRQEEELERLGLIVVRWGWGAMSNFAPVARRLELSFTRGERPGSPNRLWRVRRRP